MQPDLSAVCINEPRTFEFNEIFFSTTDKKSHIQKANEVFVRISDYSQEELAGKPHSIVRHPDMPRVVFQIVWDHLRANRPVVGYVKNRAKDGRYYWVLALMLPTQGGYLSIRFKPSSKLWSSVVAIYSELRAVEQKIEQSGQSKKVAMESSARLLSEELAKLGFANYDDFMQNALQVEIRSREENLKPSAGQTSTAKPGKSTAGDSPLAASLIAAQESLIRDLETVYHDLSFYVNANKEINVNCEFLTGLSADVRMLALNGAVETSRLGFMAAGIGKILEWLNASAQDITKDVHQLTKVLVRLEADVNTVVFSLSSARLQVEMFTSFADEMIRLGQAGYVEKNGNSSLQEGAIDILNESFAGTAEQILNALKMTAADVRPLREVLQGLMKSNRSLQLIYMRGKIEMAAVESEQLGTIFSNLESQVTDAQGKLANLNNRVEQMASELYKTQIHARELEKSIAHINTVLTQYAASEITEKTAA